MITEDYEVMWMMSYKHTHPDGQLRSIKTDEPFVFEVKKEDQKYNQAHYEALGEVSLVLQ